MDIWIKGHTFPSDVLTRLQKLVKEAMEKGAYHIPSVFAKYISIYTIPLAPRVQGLKCEI